MGRRLKLKPRLLCPGDSDHWRAAENEYGDAANAATRFRVCTSYLRFCTMNAMLPSEALPHWCGLCRTDQIEWSTIDAYSTYVSKNVIGSLTLLERERWRSWRKIIKAAHADSNTKGAMRAQSSQLNTVLTGAPLRIRRAIAAIAFTGVRLRDLKRMRRKQMSFAPKSISMQIRLSKNRRSRALRRVLRLQSVHKVVGFYVDKALCDLPEGDPEDKPFSSTTTAEINSYLRKLCLRQGWSVLTTYSFRKFFIRRVALYMKFDWPRIISWTGHCGINVVAAHYDEGENDDA